MRNDYYSNSNDYINRWVISYADFVTMLLALFMVMFALNGMDSKHVKNVNQSIEKVFTGQSAQETQISENVKNSEILQNGESILEHDGKTLLESKNGILDAEKILEKLKNDTNIKNNTTILKEKRGVVIRLSDTMLFDQGSAIIKPEALATLENISEKLREFNNPVLIEGHTDSTPIKNEKYPSNWELSTARATNIISYLIEKQKLPPERLSAVGYGEYMPVAENNSAQNKAKNRRVDIIILSSDKK